MRHHMYNINDSLDLNTNMYIILNNTKLIRLLSQVLANANLTFSTC